jgi:hypothetical protein
MRYRESSQLGKWYRLTLFDSILNIPVAEELADDYGYQTVYPILKGFLAGQTFRGDYGGPQAGVYGGYSMSKGLRTSCAISISIK